MTRRMSMCPGKQDSSQSITRKNAVSLCAKSPILIASTVKPRISASKPALTTTHLELVADSRADVAWRSVASHAWSPFSYTEYVRNQ